MYAVVVIENESDFPGVISAYGPYETLWIADRIADQVAQVNGVTRGKEVQVTQMVFLRSQR